MDQNASPTQVNVTAKRMHWVYFALALAGMYFVVAYAIIPTLTHRYYRHHPSLDDNPRITKTSDGRPGDPLNVALIGTKDQVDAIMNAAKWVPAAVQGIKSDIKIAEGTLLSRPDANAPVSNLFLFGRKEDLAFEQPVGGNPRQRNHVRFWKIDKADDDGRPIWIGSASYDEKVEFSTTTIQITHRISPDLDKERDHLFDDLKKTGDLAEEYAIDGFHKELKGKNGGGDPWYTDGRLFVGVIESRDAARAAD
jgi:LssY-like putative type I secretion system component LssY